MWYTEGRRMPRLLPRQRLICLYYAYTSTLHLNTSRSVPRWRRRLHGTITCRNGIESNERQNIEEGYKETTVSPGPSSCHSLFASFEWMAGGRVGCPPIVKRSSPKRLWLQPQWEYIFLNVRTCDVPLASGRRRRGRSTHAYYLLFYVTISLRKRQTKLFVRHVTNEEAKELVFVVQISPPN